MANKEKKPCLLCQQECDVYRYAKHSWTEYDCQCCGQFIVSDGVDSKNIKLRASMFYFLLHSETKDKRFFFVPDESIFINDGGATYVGIKTLENIYPHNFAQRVDMTLLNLAAMYSGIGDMISYMHVESSPKTTLQMALFVDKEFQKESNAEINNMFSLLSEMGFLSRRTDLKSVLRSYSISARGWLRIQELQERNKVVSQGFIAMWFDKKMDVAKERIISAIQDSGYTSMIISDKEHNNQIVPEILFEIKRSAFLVADLTGHRNGVYYEAGYAHALGKEVILTCKSDYFEARHFDISQKNIIEWNDENELYNKLVKRIVSTVGNNNNYQS